MSVDIYKYTLDGFWFTTVAYDNEVESFIDQYSQRPSYDTAGVTLFTEGAVGGHGIITEAGEAFKRIFKLSEMAFTLGMRVDSYGDGLVWVMENYLGNALHKIFFNNSESFEQSYGNDKKITSSVGPYGSAAILGGAGFFYEGETQLFRTWDQFPIGSSIPYISDGAAPYYHIKIEILFYNRTGTRSYCGDMEFYNTGVGHITFKSISPVYASNPNAVKVFFEGVTPEEEDPYTQGGTTTNGGGTGTFSHTGDDISVPGLPTLGATDAGLVTLFVPSTGELRSLGNYMWSVNFDLETFKKIFANPIDCILGLSIVPVSVPKGSSSSVKVGNIDTGVSMSKASAQYVEVDCGTLSIQEYWGSYLDYAPYTKAEIYLPYVGAHAISVDDIMGNSVSVVYHVDILSGACVAFVKCGGSVLYSFIGQCSASIPICANDWTNVINGVMQVAGNIGTMIATGGLTAPGAISSTAAAVAQTAIASKPEIEKSGSLSGTGGMLGIQTPYLIITYPKQALASRQNRFTGYPSHITTTLASINGFTIIEEGHFENMSCTQNEINEIDKLFKSGVIV